MTGMESRLTETIATDKRSGVSRLNRDGIKGIDIYRVMNNE